MDRDSSSLHADTFLDDVNHKLQNEEEGVQQSSHSSSGPTTEGLLIDEIRSRGEDRTAKGIISPLDVAEVLRRWTHALQRIHKQAVRLVWFYLFIYFEPVLPTDCQLDICRQEDCRFHFDLGELGDEFNYSKNGAEISIWWTGLCQGGFWMLKARLNDGSGPELIKDVMDGEENAHVHALHATLAEHRQHLANIQVPAAVSSGTGGRFCIGWGKSQSMLFE